MKDNPALDIYGMKLTTSLDWTVGEGCRGYTWTYGNQMLMCEGVIGCSCFL